MSKKKVTQMLNVHAKACQDSSDDETDSDSYGTFSKLSKRKYVQVKDFQDSDETDSDGTDSEDETELLVKLLQEDDRIIYKPDYELVEGSFNGKVTKYLYIFDDDDDRKYCYKFIKQGNHFTCSKCFYKKHYIKASIQKDNNDEEMVVLKTDKEHICEPIEFSLPEEKEAKIIRLPNFQLVKRRYKGKIIQRLAVFDENDPSLCYEYTWMESHNFYRCNPCIDLFASVYAKLKTSEDGEEEYVELGPTEHACSPKKFVPEDLDENTLKEPDFKLDKYIWRGSEKTRIIVYDKMKPGYFFVYGFKNNKTYICSPCEKKFHKYVIVKLCESENGEKYIEVKGEHSCKSRNTV